MQHLTPVGLSEDGDNLVLASDAGEEFIVPIDHRFRTVLRGGNVRGQLEKKMESALRPRDIQARIRAGESAEDVAAAAQTSVEAIMPFAGPVLAERAHIAQTALKASIRRRTNETSPAARTLDEAARQYLTSVDVRADDVAWDAWRRDDGRWSLIGTYVIRGTEHRATFTYDQPGRYVVADDDAARLLTGEATAIAPASSVPERRLSSVPSGDDELPLGDDAIELVRGPQPVESRESTTDLSATVEAVRDAGVPAEAPGLFVERTEPPAPSQYADASSIDAPSVDAPSFDAPSFDDLAADHADADWIAELPLDQPGAGPDDEREPADAAVADDGSTARTDEAPVPEEPAAGEQKARKKGRSSVPSWDEIMFGGGGGRE